MAGTSVYPGALDSDLREEIPTTSTPSGFRDHLLRSADAHEKMQAELGVNPSGSEADVAAAIAAALLTPVKDADETYTRRGIRFIAGSNVTVEIADDAVDNEVEVTIASTGGGVRVEDEGVSIVAVATGINFAGPGVIVTDAGANEALVTIPGGGSGVAIEDEGASVVAAATSLNFAGAGVTVTDAGANEALVTIPGGSGVSVDDAAVFAAVFGADTGLDEEFDRTNESTLPTGWSWVNQGAATFSERLGAGTIAAPSAAGDNVRAIVESISGASWSATAKLSLAMPDATGGHFGGLILRDSTTGEFIGFYVKGGSAGDPAVERWNGPTSFNATTFAPTHGSTFVAATFYMRVTKSSATSYRFEYSADGVAWAMVLDAHDPSGFLTIDQIGVMLNANTAGKNPQIACHWLRVR